MQTKEQKNKSSREWYYKNRECQIQKNREWKIKNRERMLLQKKEYHLKNRNKILERKKDFRDKNQDKIKAYRQKPEVKERMRIGMKVRRADPKFTYDKEYSKRPEVRARSNMMEKIRRKENPRSARRQNGSIEIQIAMNNVRKRDNNTCQWAGCGLTFRQSPIHVHHIFPRSEYPDFAEIEQYMICYCANHHGLWHRMRGDSYSEMILARYQENGIISNEVIY